MMKTRSEISRYVKTEALQDHEIWRMLSPRLVYLSKICPVQDFIVSLVNHWTTPTSKICVIQAHSFITDNFDSVSDLYFWFFLDDVIRLLFAFILIGLIKVAHIEVNLNID
jgi:hypothetical protein